MTQIIGLDHLTVETTPTLIHMADVDTGGIRWINDDCSEQIFMPIKVYSYAYDQNDSFDRFLRLLQCTINHRDTCWNACGFGSQRRYPVG